MILKITYKGTNATDLGYLLHKHPNRPQVFDLTFGKAYVFYPIANEEVCTASLLLDINPIDLARGKDGSNNRGIFNYVNDRPYVSSSFMSTAISKVFKTAMSGRCDTKPELVKQRLNLEAEIVMLPCTGDKSIIDKIFVPLGYETEYTTYVLDERFAGWGESKYVTLKLKGKVLLSELLSHIYVLLPVFDNQKHYFIVKDEVDKLINHGEGWLSGHPEKAFITARYLKRKKSLVDTALVLLEQTIEEADEEADEEEDEEAEAGTRGESLEQREKAVRLNDLRLQAVFDRVAEAGAKSVIDLGCGEGRLLIMLTKNKQLTKLTGVDVSMLVLERAKAKIKRLPEKVRERITLMQSSLTYKDNRFSGYDVACVTEVVEHLDIARLAAFERVLFQLASPSTVILTTPNAEYNVNYPWLKAEHFRHSDHRFEWTRTQFKEWAEKVCEKYGYTVEILGIGELDENSGTPTQMGVFKKCV